MTMSLGAFVNQRPDRSWQDMADVLLVCLFDPPFPPGEEPADPNNDHDFLVAMMELPDGTEPTEEQKDRLRQIEDLAAERNWGLLET
jgi:hypothetical protein